MRLVAEVSSDGLLLIEDGGSTRIKKADRHG